MDYDYIECGDCLELMKNIPDGSIDLVLTDPPYGTMDTDGGRKIGIRGWDKALPTKQMFEQISRVLRQNGKAVLFGQEPFTSKTITEAIPSLPFCYRAIWLKNTFGNCLGSNKNLVNYFEDICLFCKPCPKYDYESAHPLRVWFKNEFQRAGINSKKCADILGNGMYSHYCTDGFQFTIPTETNYKKLQQTGFFCRDYEEIKNIHDKWQKDCIDKLNAIYPSVFNLWQGGKSKSNVFEYAKDNDKYHPTQKPVLLLEDLIKTYSNEGDAVLDFTMGSGSTCVAAVNTNRHYIGFEKDPKYFDIACKRLDEAEGISENVLQRVHTYERQKVNTEV